MEDNERFMKIEAAHRENDMHHGYNYTLERLKGLSWPGKIKDVKDFLLSCDFSRKKENARELKKQKGFVLDIARFPMEIVAIDLYEFYDRKYLSMLDYYSDLLFVKFI